MNYFLIIVISFFTLGHITAQTLADRLSISVGAAANASTNYEPGMLSLSFIPSYRLNKNLGFSFKYKNYLFQFGTRGKWHANNQKYRYRKSYLNGLQSFSFSPDLHFRLLGAHVVLSPELVYFFRPEILEKTVSYFSQNLIGLRTITPKNGWGYSLTSGVVFDKIHTGIVLSKTKDIELIRSSTFLMSVFINYPIINKELHSTLKAKNDRNDIPLFIVEGGIQPYGNFGKYAGGFNYYIETNLSIGKKWMLGFRANTKTPNGVGFDKEDAPIVVSTSTHFLLFMGKQEDNGQCIFKITDHLPLFPKKRKWMVFLLIQALVNFTGKK